MRSIAVFCGANPGNKPYFAEATRQLGHTLAQRDILVQFGGGSVGLMGILADAVLEAGGRIRGIITYQLNNLELGHPGVTDMVIVDSMSERRNLLLDNTDGVITLPGGFGSMDEHFEALTLAQLHQYQKPIGLLNVQGYYDPLLTMLDNMTAHGFLKQQNRSLCIDADSVDTLIQKMESYEYNAIGKWL
jgi:uncharacterized protein (TIGR00730 family)